MANKRYGIAGCGMMGVEHIRNLDLLDGAEVAAVYDPVAELAEQASRLAHGARIAADFDAMVDDPELDALVLVSPNHLHVDQLQRIARGRPRPVLCEKPLYTRTEDADAIAALQAAYPAPVWVAMEYRYMPPIAALVRDAHEVTGGVQMLVIREHRFAFLDKVDNWNRFNATSGGTFVEKCCHFFDLMRLILRAEPVRVMASAGQAVNHLEERYDGRAPDIWDHGFVICEFDNATRAMLDLCMFADGSRWNEEISAVGRQGKIECRLPGPHRFWPHETLPMPNPQLSISPRAPKNPVTRDIPIEPELLAAGDHHGSTFYQHQRFLQVVRGEAEPEVTLHDGARAVEIGLAAQQSVIEQRVVTLDRQV